MKEKKSKAPYVIIVALVVVIAMLLVALLGETIGIFVLMGQNNADDTVMYEVPTNEYGWEDTTSIEYVRNRLGKHNYAAAVAYIDYTGMYFNELKESFEDGAVYDFPYLRDITRDRFVELPGGELYLVVPKSEKAQVMVSEYIMDENGEILEGELIYESNTGEPFIVRGNVSDIFSNICIKIKNPGEELVACSPWISLRDGSVVVGDDILDITVADYLYY